MRKEPLHCFLFQAQPSTALFLAMLALEHCSTTNSQRDGKEKRQTDIRWLLSPAKSWIRTLMPHCLDSSFPSLQGFVCEVS